MRTQSLYSILEKEQKSAGELSASRGAQEHILEKFVILEKEQ